MRLPVISLPWALAIAGGLAGGIVALQLGFALEWDLLNYHLYNPHALLHSRWAIDIAPAQQQTFLNPAFHVPVYLLFRYAGPEALVFTLGLVQGAQLLLLWWLAVRLASPRAVPAGWLILVALLGLGGPVFLSELGVSQGDSVLSALVLGGLLLLLPEKPGEGVRPVVRNAALAGLLLGAATGLKLVFGPYAAALGIALLASYRGRSLWRGALAYGAGGLLGVLLTGGPWFAFLWAEYQSPLFPYFNDLFRSGWMDETSLRDLRFMPQTWLDWLAYPFIWLIDPQRVWEWSFRDIRPVVLIPAAVAALLLARRRMPANLLFSCVFVLVSYGLWLAMFSIYRYLVVVEMIAPVILFAIVLHWSRDRRAVLAALAVLLVSQVFVRFHRYEPAWEFRADQPSVLESLPEDAMVIIDGYEPVAFVALWLDDEIPLVRVRANFMAGETPRSELHGLAEQRVREHSGPVFVLLSPADLEQPFFEADLARMGLDWQGPVACRPVFPHPQLQQRVGLRLCSVSRPHDILMVETR